MNQQEREAFRALGVAAGSDAEAIISAYRRGALATHPDVVADLDATKRFAELSAAYRVALGWAVKAPPTRGREDGSVSRGFEADGDGGRRPIHGQPSNRCSVRVWSIPMDAVPARRRDLRVPFIAGPVYIRSSRTGSGQGFGG